MLEFGRVTPIKQLHIALVVIFSLRTSYGQQCGNTLSRPQSSKLVGKIFGGYEVGYYKYPWFASLQHNGGVLCGGALIGPNVVLTAAHCFDPFIVHNISLEDAYDVVLGANDNCEMEATRTTYTVTKVHLHEMYAKNKPYYDIALMILSGNTEQYEPVCLPPQSLSDREKQLEGKIIGFGSMADGPNGYPCTLREARILLYDSNTCIDMIKTHTSIPSEYAFINSLCAGYKQGGVDSCSGDSGGPLMTFDAESGTWQSIGITSFGWGCAKENAMGIYTDVSKYLDWIQAHSGIKPSSTQGSESQSQESFANAIIAMYELLFGTKYAPKEIVIQFKNKRERELPRNIKSNKNPLRFLAL